MNSRKILFPALVVAVAGVIALLVPKQADVSQDNDVENAHPTLPEADRKLLWEAEHQGLVLTKNGWNPALKRLFQDRDTTAFLKCLPDSFRAVWPADQPEVSVEYDGLSASVNRAEGDTEFLMLDRRQFTEKLAQLGAPFAADVSTHFKLLGVHPADRDAPDGDWKGKGRITLTGTTGEGHLHTVQLGVSYVTVRPDSEVVKTGAWLKSLKVTKERIVDADHPLFTDVTSESGFVTSRLYDNWKRSRREVNTGGIFLCDYNRDGCTDVLVTDIKDFAGIMLYEGSADSTFTDVTVERGLPHLPGTMTAAFADLDNDGWEDLVIPDAGVFRNEKGQRFVSVTDRSNLNALIYAVGNDIGLLSITGLSIADFDCDGRVDLHVTRGDVHGFRNGSWIDGKSGQSTPCQLLRNTGDFQFEDVTFQANAGGGGRSVFTSVWLDADGNRWPDLYVINEFGAGALFVNEKGQRFTEVELDDHSSDFASMGLSAGDFDNNGLTDLYVSNMFSSAGNRVMDNLPPGFYDDTVTRKLRRMVAGNQLHMNEGNLKFRGRGPELDVAQVGWGWGPALADFNNDGWLDIYATCGFMSHTRADPDG